MDLGFAILPTPAGLVLGASAVVLGAPLFNDGLRALRLRRLFSSLREAPLTPDTQGFAHARGEVMLESPLFSPIGARPCAGFQLEVAGVGRSIRGVVEERRGFRIGQGGVIARVPGGIGRWNLDPTATRTIEPGEPVSANLAALLQRVPEAVWLRRAGVTITLTERALLAGRPCHVVGTVRSAQAVSYEDEMSLERTGTDDVDLMAEALAVSAAVGAVSKHTPAEPTLAFGGGEHLGYLLVSSGPPTPTLLRVSPLRVAGVALGPALTMTGILYLAALADVLRAAGRS